MKNLILFLFAILCFFNSNSQTPAFPSAEGFGKWATGGRGGKVVEVTTVEDDGVGNLVGSFRWALKQYPGQPITIVFRVSGIIDLKGIELRSKRNNITIAGQTAPGDGICFKGESINFGGSYNLIIRNLRFRTGAYTPTGVAINAASFILENGGNFIIDHCSMSWSSEELCDIADDINLTTQWCIFAEGLYNSVNGKGARGYGPVIAGQNATYHHNLLASNVSRSPRFGVTTDVTRFVLIDYVNNVNYNFGKSTACYGGENEKGKFGTEKINFVNNYYKQGPAYPNNRTAKFVAPSYEVGLQDTFYTKWHLSGNFIEGETNKNLNSNNYIGVDISEYKANLPACTIENLMSNQHAITYPANTETAFDAFKSVLAKSGAFPRDTVDKRIVKEAETGLSTAVSSFNAYNVSGIIDKPEDVGGWPAYNTYNIINDNDHDGMDDAWETSNNLNPMDSEDRNKVTLSGYTALEVYLNSLMGENIELKFNTAVDNLNIKPKMELVQTHNIISINSVSEIKELKIFDVDGREMNLCKNIQQNIIDIASLKSGVYFISAISKDEEKASFKFIRKQFN